MSDWKEVDGGLEMEFKFKDFKQAWGFMSQVALIAESTNHHPEWSNVYNKINIRLSTHDAGGIVTEKDRNMADEIDQLLISTK